MNLEEIRALMRNDLDALDTTIRRRLSSDVLLVNQVAEYIIAGGGKRLRPLLVITAAGACGYNGPHHVDGAAIIEFIHTATLLHDDVVDESDLRRGKESAHAVWGDAASVLVGDFLYSRAFQMMVGIDDMRVMRVMADATNTIAAHPVVSGIGEGSWFYYLHSYALPTSSSTIAMARHTEDFSAMVCRNNFLAGQFHPERSSHAGARLLQNFMEWEL